MTGCPDGPLVRLIACTDFSGVPPELAEFVRPDQDEGSDLARLTEAAGRTCYDSYNRGRSSADYHQHILEVGHGSVLAHASMTFYIANISRNCSHEWVRHAAGCGISQRSTRFCDESLTSIAYHPFFDKYLSHPDWVEVENLQRQSRLLYTHLTEVIQSRLKEEGVDPVSARKQARGAARGVLPSALGTALIWTANLRALRNVIEQRCHPAADAEIRLLAGQVFLLAQKQCPEYFADYQVEEAPDGIGFVVSTAHRKV